MDWDRQADTRDFPMSRRARVLPEEAALRAYGGVRRVPGLHTVAPALQVTVNHD